VLVVERVTDDQRLLALDHALDDAVRELAHAVADVLVLEVARDGDPRALRLDQDHEALVGIRHLDHGVEQRRQQLGHRLNIHQPLAEVVELA
jgi:hypothetical protein